MNKIARDLESVRGRLADERIRVQARIREQRARLAKPGVVDGPAAQAELRELQKRANEIQQEEATLKTQARQAWQLRWDRAFVNAAKELLTDPLFKAIKAAADRLIGRKPK